MANLSGLSKSIYNGLKLLLNLMGVVLLDDANCRLRKAQTLFMSVIYASCFLLSCVGFRYTEHTLEDVIRQSTEAFSTAFCLFLTWWVAFNKDDIWRVFAALNRGIVQYKTSLTPHQIRLKETGHNTSKAIVFSVLYSISFFTVVRLLFPFLAGCYKLYKGVEKGANLPIPMAIWPPMASDTFVKYTALYLYTTICVLGMSTIYTSVAAFLFTSIIYAKLEIKILADNILLLQAKSKDEMYSSLRDVVQYHEQILSFVKLLNETFGLVTLFMVEIIGILICLDFYQMSENQSLFSSSSLSLSGTVSAALIVLWSFSWFGQSLIDEDNRLRTAMYNTNWLEWPKNNKENLLLMMQRTSHPMCIKIAGIQTIDYSIFITVTQFCYSCYNILHSVQAKK